MKTNSEFYLTLYVTLILTALTGFFLFLSYFIAPDFGIIFLYMIIFLIISFAVMYFMFKRFVNQKVKPLNKIIHDISASQEKLDTGKSDEEIEKKVKNQTEQILRLKEIEKYRKEFVGNVSHELKTPIFNIQGYILTLLEGGMNDPKIKTLYLQRAEKSVDRMISIVEDLESITKLESGELQLKKEKFDIVKLFEEVFELEQMLAAEKNILLKFNPKPENSIYVNADKKRITEALNNLVSNAIKYNKDGGEVKVSINDDMENHVMITVSDTGIGIEEQNLSRVFERFFRVDKSRSREQGGTGLGLSIVKHIIDGHGFKIQVTSAINEGTTFSFPLEKAK